MTTYRKRWKTYPTNTPASNYHFNSPLAQPVATKPTIGAAISAAAYAVEIDAVKGSARLAQSIEDLCMALAQAVLAGREVNVYSTPYEARSTMRGHYAIKIDAGNVSFVRYLTPAHETQIINAIKSAVLHAGWQWAKGGAVQS
jgi:hypothetical protein